MWIHVPSTHLPSAPASAVSNLESRSPSHVLAGSVTSREKPTQPRFWLRAWKMGLFPRLQYGATLERSTLTHGVESFISSLQETHASPTARPESGLGSPTTDGFSTTPYASSRACGLVVSSERTCRGMQADNSRPSFLHWKEWATALRREFSQREKSAPGTSENDCSSWPTVATRDFRSPNSQDSQDSQDRRNEGSSRGQQLPNFVEHMWPTPWGSDGQKGGPNQRGSKGDLMLTSATHMWETPTKAVTDGSRLSRGGDRAGEMLLTGQAVSHSSPQDHQTQDGQASSMLTRYVRRQYLTLTSPRIASFARLRVWVKRVSRRRLNEHFVEWMHGWPIGWTDSERAVTGFQAWLQRSRIELSRLASKPENGDLW